MKVILAFFYFIKSSFAIAPYICPVREETNHIFLHHR